jgi:uncharacterized membrane protein YbjE (DUF340 family)
MLTLISWHQFLMTLLALTSLYYLTILAIYYRKETLRWIRKRLSMLVVCLLFSYGLMAQTADGNAGLSQANTLVRSYFDTGTQLMYAVAAILALVGAVKVFQLWNGGHREDVNRVAAGWFGSCVFIVIVATVIKSFFGL